MVNLLKNDKVANGVVIGIITSLFSFGVLTAFGKLFENYPIELSLLKHPRIECLLLAINIILFRFLIVKWDRLEIAKGFFLILFLSFLIYLYALKYHFINY